MTTTEYMLLGWAAIATIAAILMGYFWQIAEAETYSQAKAAEYFENELKSIKSTEYIPNERGY